VSEDTTARSTASKRKMTVYYVILAAVTAVVAALVITAGDDKTAQPTIAGGYDAAAPNACFGAPPAKPTGAPLPATAPPTAPVAGPSFDVKQSGEFVNLSNVQGTLSGKLRLDGGQGDEGPRKLSGDVNCADGKTKHFEGTVTPGSKAEIKGAVGGAPLSAVLRRDPPDPGAPKQTPPSGLASLYKVSPRSTCLGGNFELNKSGDKAYTLEAKDRELGKLAYNDENGVLTGDVECLRGGSAKLRATAVDRNLNNVQIIPLDTAAPAPGVVSATGKPVMTTPSGLSPAGERFTATKARESFGHLVAVFFLAVAFVMLIARLFGSLAVRIRQPRVMGEVVAGITLGPTIFGAIAPDLQSALFPSDILPAFGIAANLGLIFYLFLVGLEVDSSQLKGRVSQAAAISNTSVALPMMLGIAVALPLYTLVGPNKEFVAFALFMGVAMSITAFPVLARILVERRMLKRPLGALTLACAAIDDVTAWFLIALATAVATAGGFGEVVTTIALAIAFTLFMAVLIRPLLGRVSTAYDEAGRVPGGWIVAIFAGILLSAYATEEIGIAVIFGAFIMGMIMPRHARLTDDVTRRIEDIVVIVLLPMFFAYTGLRTNIGLLDRPILWGITLLLIAVAIVGKFFGAMIAARATGWSWRGSAVIGTLMNTRGLTELIVLNLALEKGVISEALFAMLVIMALVTTFMAGPLLSLLDPKNEYGAPVEEELEEARRVSSIEFPDLPVPEKSILVAPQDDASLEQLRALAEPLAQSDPPRELIVARLVRPPRRAATTGGLQTENKLLKDATDEVTFARLDLMDKGIAARSVAFTSVDPGADLVRLAKSEEVDLLLMDGRRPLLGEGVPRGDVGTLLREAECDVAVLVARDDQDVLPSPDASVLVPFGGAEHDWAALELGAWLAARTGAHLQMLGAVSDGDDPTRVTRLLGDASLLVQQYAGISAEPVVAEGGREGIVEAASEAGLLVVGLSERWRQEGLGATRSEIAKAAPAATLFVRRGLRPGALAPRGDVTRFTWSSPDMGGVPSLGGLQPRPTAGTEPDSQPKEPLA
jgi:Kef-type K+ transport system membrane component KefB